MPHHGQESSDAEVLNARSAGLEGAIHGAAVWGVGFLVLGFVGQAVSPVYRNLTFQFKVFLQMSGMTIGSVIEADQRLRDFEKHARRLRKLKKDQQSWRVYEEEYARRVREERESEMANDTNKT